jgi:hypothetical protein
MVVLTNCGVTTLKTEKIKMKYAIIETWNGESYSSENLASIKEFDNDSVAQKYLESLVESLHFPTPAKIIESSLGCISYEKGDDQGSFTFIRNAENFYGVVILTNVNEVVVIRNKKDWSAKLNIAIQQCQEDELDEIDLSDDNIFIGAYDGDYDYQFIKF